MLTLALAIAMLAPQSPAPYPRIGNLWGYGSTSSEYDLLARHALLVMDRGTPPSWRKLSAEVRRRNPHTRILGTGAFMNLVDPRTMPWMKDEWYLRRPNGDKVTWWADTIVLPNILRDDCLDALVENVVRDFDEPFREHTIDGLFFDSVVGSATWLGEVDTDGDGRADTPADVDPRWRARQCLFFDRLRARWPDALIMANDLDIAHAPHVHGRLFEGIRLLQAVTDGTMSGADAIGTLDQWLAGTLQPPVSFAIMTHPLGWQAWRVDKGARVTTKGEQERARRDFRRMRAGLAMTLMTDAYYAYDFGTTWYGLHWWYAEYDAPLGRALGAARQQTLGQPLVLLDWQGGSQIGPLVLGASARDTPSGVEVRRADPGEGWERVLGTDPERLVLKPGKAYRIEAECTISGTPSGTIQFNARTETGGWEHHDKGRATYTPDFGRTWRIDTTIVPDEFTDYSIEWHVHGAANFRVTRLKVTLLDECTYRRDFAGGIALLNPLPAPVTVRLDRPMRRIADPAAPRYAIETDDADGGFAARGAWEVRAVEGRYVGATHRRAIKIGSRASWTFTAPSSDRYTIYACLPGGKDLSTTASYTVRDSTGRALATTVVDQTRADGGWVRLFNVALTRGRPCRAEVTSSGTGTTVADAILAESAARYNDGATVRTVTLPPLDGVILLNPSGQSAADRTSPTSRSRTPLRTRSSSASRSQR